MTAPARFGRYEIVRRLGSSMTDVYLAIDTVENRKAALKLVKSGGDSVSRLVMEAERRGAAIQTEMRRLDPRVVQVYEYGDHDGYFYVAMEFVEGHDLAEVLHAEHCIEPTRAAIIALEICEQLVKFHSWGSAVVHGDIKPSNIHLGLNDTVRLLDFGIAKTLRADSRATVHNFGSPSYCSPERLTRSEVDEQSDLWAVGATLYEMLSGKPPYHAEDTRKLETLIRSKRPPRALPPNCPRALRFIVTKALAPTPAQRYRSAAELQSDLQAFLERKPTLAEKERRAAWSPNATMEAARVALRKATRTVARANRSVRIAGGIGWFALGMGLWVGGTFAVQGWQAWEERHAVHTLSLPPAPKPNENMPLLYVAAADRILEAHRANPVADVDWQKAELCLERAVELGGGDDRTLGKLALARGYAALQRLDTGQYSQATATQLRAAARDEFQEAAKRLPDNPEPKTALAGVEQKIRAAAYRPPSPAHRVRRRRIRRRTTWR